MSPRETDANCVYAHCNSYGGTIEKPCRCSPRPRYHVECIQAEARAHWATCTGCTCRRDRVYPCGDCQSSITLVHDTSKLNTCSGIVQTTFASPMAVYILTIFPVIWLAVTFALVTSFTLTGHTGKWLSLICIAISPMLLWFIDLEKMPSLAVYRDNHMMAFMCAFLSVALTCASSVLLVFSFNSAFATTTFGLLTISFFFATYRIMRNVAVIRCFLSPVVMGV